MIGRVWEVLCFKAEGGTGVVRPAGLAQRSIERIAGIKLQAGFGGADLDGAARARLINLGGDAQFAWFAVKNEILIVAVAALQLLVGLVDMEANDSEFAEIEWSAFYGTKFACRN